MKYLIHSTATVITISYFLIISGLKLGDGLISLNDLRVIMEEIGEEIHETDLNEMITATNSVNGKGNFFLKFNFHIIFHIIFT